MKHLLLTTIAAVVLVGCGKSAQESSTEVKAPDMSIHFAAWDGNIEAVKQHLADGADVDTKSERGRTPLHSAAMLGHKEIAELLIAEGADLEAMDDNGETPLDLAIGHKHPETADLLRKHGGKTSEELKTEGN